MAITLNGIPLSDGLRWSDEFNWSPLQATTDYSLTGALIIQNATRLAGRPITLIGGESFAWMTRTQLIALQTLLDTYTTSMTLVLHDARSFSVIPVYSDRDGPLDATQKSRIQDSGFSNPNSEAWYVIHSLKLQTT